MSKHSKWSKVKHQKAVTDVRKAAVYTKMARLITVAARESGGDPAFNFKLRTAIDSALAANLPRENIERAIKRGTGEIKGDATESVLYEGYGPGGIGILVEALTDNRNRTSGNIKYLFSSHGGNLAGSGAVQWMFDRRGVVRLSDKGPLPGSTILSLIDAGAFEIDGEGDEVAISCKPEALGKIRAATDALGLHVAEAGFEWKAKEPKDIDDVVGEQLRVLVEALEEDEDVSEVFTAAD